jgi:hypothetical protein
MCALPDIASRSELQKHDGGTVKVLFGVAVIVLLVFTWTYVH